MKLEALFILSGILIVAAGGSMIYSKLHTGAGGIEFTASHDVVCQKCGTPAKTLYDSRHDGKLVCGKCSGLFNE